MFSPGAGGSLKKCERFNEDDLFSDTIFSSSGTGSSDGGRSGSKKHPRMGEIQGHWRLKKVCLSGKRGGDEKQPTGM